MSRHITVMTGLDPVIHAFFGFAGSGIEDVDGRIKSGHDMKRRGVE